MGIVDLKVYNLPDIYFAEIVRGMAKRVYPTAYVRFGSKAEIRLATPPIQAVAPSRANPVLAMDGLQRDRFYSQTVPGITANRSRDYRFPAMVPWLGLKR